MVPRFTVKGESRNIGRRGDEGSTAPHFRSASCSMFHPDSANDGYRNRTTHPMPFVSRVFCRKRSIEKVDWLENAQWPQWTEPIGNVSPHSIFSAAITARESSHHLPHGCSQGSQVHRDWVGTGNGTGNGPMASLAFEPL
jgi:hypothetical protein